jgi:hypothetical protein
MTDTRTTLETQTCSRCGGCGRHSYCEMYGDTCFKCAGSGKVYTTRGKVALAYLRSLRTVKAGDVKVGQRVFIRSYGKFNVKEITINPRGASCLVDGVEIPYVMVTLRGEKMGMTMDVNSDVEIILPTVAERNAQFMAALAYQGTLTKTGTVRKKGAAK